MGVGASLGHRIKRAAAVAAKSETGAAARSGATSCGISYDADLYCFVSMPAYR